MMFAFKKPFSLFGRFSAILVNLSACFREVRHTAMYQNFVPVAYTLSLLLVIDMLEFKNLSDLTMGVIKIMEDYSSSGSSALRLYFAWSLSHCSI